MSSRIRPAAATTDTINEDFINEDFIKILIYIFNTFSKQYEENKINVDNINYILLEYKSLINSL